MKKVLFLILMITGLVFTGKAQPGSITSSMNVWGFVSDSMTGLPIKNHVVVLQEDSVSLLSHYSDTTITAENGYYHFTVPLNGMVEIDFKVFTIDCKGIRHSISFLSPLPVNPFNFSICDITHPAHCEAEFIFNKNPYNPVEVAFHDFSTGNIHHWFWEFGDGTTSTQRHPFKQYQYAGNYHVILTVYDTLPNPHCHTADTMSVNINTAGYYNVAGQIFHGFFPVASGTTDIFRKENSKYVFESTASINSNGVFYFYQAYNGQYLLRSYASDNTTPPYDLPTYFGNSLFWNESVILPLTTNFYYADIHMINAPGVQPGPGSVGGALIDSSAYPKPVEGTTIFLFDKNMNPLDVAFIGQNSDFNFTSIDTGTYIVYPEIPGKWTVPATVTVDSAHLEIDLLFVINGPYVLSNENPANDVSGIVSMDVIPNPTFDNATVFITGNKTGKSHFRLADITGNQILTWNEETHGGLNKVIVPLANLKQGIYFFTVTQNKQSLTKKIIKL